MKWFDVIRGSLRNRVLAWLILPLVVISCVILIRVYATAVDSTQKTQDQLLLSHAIAIAEHVIRTDGDFYHLDITQNYVSSNILYRAMGSKGNYNTGYHSLPKPANDLTLYVDTPFFYDSEYLGFPIRMVALKNQIQTPDDDYFSYVYVGEYQTVRQTMIWKQVFNVSTQLGLFIVIASLFTWLAVNQSLRPLTRLQESITRRSFDDMRPIHVDAPREIKPVLDELNRLLYRLDNSIQTTKRFTANASHQLRTPVASILAQTELLLRQTVSSQSIEQLNSIRWRSVQMSSLIKQLLTLTQANGYDKKNYTSIELVSFVAKVCTDWYNRQTHRRVELNFVPKAESLTVLGSELLLQEALTNLMDNANHYCPQGSQFVVAVVQENNRAVIKLDDNGDGIPVQNRQTVIEPFSRLKEDHQGTGLGLAIANEVAINHDGDLQLVDSDLGQGLGVRLRLPLI